MVGERTGPRLRPADLPKAAEPVQRGHTPDGTGRSGSSPAGQNMRADVSDQVDDGGAAAPCRACWRRHRRGCRHQQRPTPLRPRVNDHAVAHVSYDATQGYLGPRLFRPRRRRWRFSVIDATGDVGASAATAVSATMTYVVCRDSAHGDLRAAAFDRSARRCHLTTLDGDRGGGRARERRRGRHLGALCSPAA